MANTNTSEKQNINEMMDRIQALEGRIQGLENYLGLVRRDSEVLEHETQFKQGSDNIVSESNIVEHGLAWLSSVIFLFGIIFLMNYISSLGYPGAASITGYLSTIGIIAFAHIFRKVFPHLVFVLKLSSLLLVYYITLKLHFLTQEPLLDNLGLASILLLLSVAGQYYYVFKRNSQGLAIMATFFLLLSALFIGITHFTLPLLLVACLVSTSLLIRKGWEKQVIITLLMVYIAHLIWLVNNPVAGNPLEVITESQNNLLYLFGYAMVFTSIIYIKNGVDYSEYFLGSLIILNALFFSAIVGLESYLLYQASYMWIFAFIAILCLAFSVVLKYRKTIPYAPALYACFGFMAISISIYGFLKFPGAYGFLILQSFLVVSMAIWFRSKLIVIGNTFLFMLILLVYFFSAESIIYINFMIAFVALGTARVLNWKKERLTLKTEYLRNIYLAVAFIMLLYGLSEALPPEYVTLSWIFSAIIYLILSFAIKNLKYRWMAILTIVVSGGHLLLVDMSSMSMGLRVVVFLLFAVVTLGISLFYSKRIKKGTF